MRILFTRHGERRSSDPDGGLTSAGHAMARETALWAQDLGLRPARIVCTPTTRTRETADEFSLVFPGAARTEDAREPHFDVDWDRFVDVQMADAGADETLVVVGHHPTLELLVRRYGPPSPIIPRHHLAAALVLTRGEQWRLDAAWPGRPPNWSPPRRDLR